jgi:hypothetical protein
MQAQYAGTCKGPDKHTWNPGDEVFYDKATKAICSDGKCFQALKAAGGQSGNGKTPTVPVRTVEQKTEDARNQIEILWPMAMSKATILYHPDYTMEKATQLQGDDPKFDEILHLAVRIFRELSLVWSKP